VADELDNDAAFTPGVIKSRRAQIIAAIMPARATVIALVIKIGATALSLADNFLQMTYRQDLMHVADRIDDITNKKASGPKPP
jgi:hypothetical protein